MTFACAGLHRAAVPACCSARPQGASGGAGACSRLTTGPQQWQRQRQRLASGGASACSSRSSSSWLASPPHRQQQQWRQRRGVPARAGKDDTDLDPIERLVGKLFGKAALEDPTPGGLKRLSDEAAKELYPATTDEWAEPLPGDGPDVAALRPLLAQTQLESVPLRLAYDADSDGWTPAAFHAAVDGFGATLVVAETDGGALVGGYSPRGWISLGEDRDATAAFLFTWRDGDFSRRPIKLPKVGGPALAVVKDAPNSGIFFGPDGLHIPLAPGNERAARCKLGPYYARMPGGGKSLFGESEGAATQLAGLRAYVAEGSGEEWELNGIVWSTKRKA